MTSAPRTASSVTEAARALGCAPQTVRRLLQMGRLAGSKLGRDWIVWGLPTDGESATPGSLEATPAMVRTRLRAIGTRLITVGNAVAETVPRPGAVFLTWRAPRGLRVTFAIGRTSPRQGWAPYAVGVELPFWLTERTAWRPVLPLLRHYDQVRSWCVPRLLRVPGVGAVVLAELARLEATLDRLEATQTQRPEDLASREESQ